MSKILLLGDSSIERFPKEFLENDNHQVINAGIKNIEIPAYYEYIPKIFNKINDNDYTILQLGLTNLLNIKHKNIDILIDQIRKIIYAISKTNTNLIVLPLYPTRNAKLNNQISEYNYALAQLCYEGEIEFLDVYNILLDEKKLLKSNYTNKGFKLNKTGFEIVANQIKEYFRLLENNYFK